MKYVRRFFPMETAHFLRAKGANWNGMLLPCFAFCLHKERQLFHKAINANFNNTFASSFVAKFRENQYFPGSKTRVHGRKANLETEKQHENGALMPYSCLVLPLVYQNNQVLESFTVVLV